MQTQPDLFKSFFIGGFECSTHRLRSGKRLDLLRATRHDEFAATDYRLLQKYGMYTAREGLRWHLIETAPGRFDFSSAKSQVGAARETQMQVIWDLWHYGWPDDLDIFSTEFVRRFTAFARTTAEMLSQNFTTPFVCPVNEISFFSWAGGESGIFNPFVKNRGNEMKRQLVRSTIAATIAMREVNPAIRFCYIDPMINVIPRKARPEDTAVAEAYRLSQFEGCDMVTGRAAPELGGRDDFIDAIGVNYYIHNQWRYPGGHGMVVVPSDPRYRHVRDMLAEYFRRYRKPVFVAETGIEDETRPAWLRYMSNELCAAMTAGVPVAGLCLYPIVNHPGWEDDRHCYNGLLDYADDTGHREPYGPLAEEIGRQGEIIRGIRTGRTPFQDRFEADTSALDWASHVMEERTDESRALEDASC